MRLTKKQFQILQFIWDYQAEEGYSPTLAEIGQRLGITRMTVHEHVVKLEAKGVIERVKDESRSITILKPDLVAEPDTGLPLLGTITAGLPIEAIENRETFSMTDLLPPGGNCYVLKVQGDSMIEDGICDGDFVIIEKTETALNGQTVVAVIDDNEATLKKLYKEDNRFRLQPANSSMEPFYRDHVEVRGIVVGIYRKL